MPAKKINPEKRYRVTVKNTFKAGRSVARAGAKCVVSGELLTKHKDDVSDYQEV